MRSPARNFADWFRKILVDVFKSLALFGKLLPFYVNVLSFWPVWSLGRTPRDFPIRGGDKSACQTFIIVIYSDSLPRMRDKPGSKCVCIMWEIYNIIINKCTIDRQHERFSRQNWRLEWSLFRFWFTPLLCSARYVYSISFCEDASESTWLLCSKFLYRWINIIQCMKFKCYYEIEFN